MLTVSDVNAIASPLNWNMHFVSLIMDLNKNKMKKSKQKLCNNKIEWKKCEPLNSLIRDIMLNMFGSII